MTEKYPLDTIGGYGPVVQLDRMLPSEGKDRWFESNRVRHRKKTAKLLNGNLAVFFYWEGGIR